MLNVEVLDCIHEDHMDFSPHHAPTVQSDSQIDIRSDLAPAKGKTNAFRPATRFVVHPGGLRDNAQQWI